VVVRVAALRDRFADQIHALDDEFWDQRARCAYATLIDVHVSACRGECAVASTLLA
jgi:hypothetical protein